MSDSEKREIARLFGGFEAMPVPVTVRVGRARCTLAQLSALEPDQLILLDRGIGQPFDLLSGDVTLGRVEPVAAAEGVAVKLIQVAGDDDDPTA